MPCRTAHRPELPGWVNSPARPNLGAVAACNDTLNGHTQTTIIPTTPSFCARSQDYLAREWQARSAYPEEVDRWYSFLYENLEPVEALIGRSNELAERHKLPALRPLAAAPLVLKLRDEEIALEKEKRVRHPRGWVGRGPWLLLLVVVVVVAVSLLLLLLLVYCL